MDAADRTSGWLRQRYATLKQNWFFWVSVAVHAIVILVATVFVVQSIITKRKVTFESGGKRGDASSRALEYKVSAPQSPTTMAMPAIANKITANGASKIVLPDMPEMPQMDAMLPTTMAGMSSPAMSMGSLGNGNAVGVGGGGRLTFFGFQGNRSGGGLVGRFYDLKQPRNKGTGISTEPGYSRVIGNFGRENFPAGAFRNFFRAPITLNATQFMIPSMKAEEGPKAFGVEKEVKPTFWVAHYKGRVSPEMSGKIRFVGAGDDVLLVKFDGKVVLDSCWWASTGIPMDGVYHYKSEQMGRPLSRTGFKRSFPIEAKRGQWYDMEVLIGEQGGGRVGAFLFIEEEGKSYSNTKDGSPILPLFRLQSGELPALEEAQLTPPYQKDGPVWRVERTLPGMASDE